MAKIGLIGCGRWGQNLMQELLAAGASVYVVDISDTARDLAKASKATGVFATVDDLPEVDGYLIATPSSTHAEVARSVLGNDVPVIIEKPITLNLRETEKLLTQNDKQVFELHAWRYHPAIQKMSEMLQQKQLGKLHWLRTLRANWTSPSSDSDPIWALLPHNISIMLELLGELPTVRSAVAELCARKPVGITACLETKSGVKCIAEVSTRYSQRHREVRVHCENGVMELSRDAGTLQIVYGKHNEFVYEVEEHTFDHISTLQVQMQAVISFLEGGEPPKSNAKESLAMARLIHEIRQSAGIEVKTQAGKS